MRIIVTGGAGFIGGHTSNALTSRGDEVLVIDNLSSGKRENVPKDARFVEIDIRSPEALSIFDEYCPDAVIHFAAQVSVLTSIRDPEFDSSVNVDGSVNILSAAIRAGCSAFVNISTGIVYGEPSSNDAFPVLETQPKKLPFPYSQSKFEFEKHIFDSVRSRKINAITLRPGNIYGPRQDPHGEAGVVAIFAQRLIAKQPLLIHGTGEATRDYVYIDDMVNASLAALDKLYSGCVNFCASGFVSPDDVAINIGTGIGTNVIEIADSLEMLAVRSGYRLSGRIRGDARPNEVARIELDNSKANELMNWTPRVELIEGLAVTFDWFAKSARCSV